MRSTAVRSLKPTTRVRSMMAVGMPELRGHAPRAVGRTGLVELGGHRHLHRVVVTVVAALDLDDQVPAGDGPHQVDGVHGGLGTRVVEPPQRQAEPAASSSATSMAASVGWAKWVPASDLRPDRLDDGRMRVSGQAGAVAAVQVDVLVAVDVEDLGAGAVAEPDRLGRGDLPARGDPAGQRVVGPLPHGPGAGLALDEGPFLAGDELVESGGDVLHGGCFDDHERAPSCGAGY